MGNRIFVRPQGDDLHGHPAPDVIRIENENAPPPLPDLVLPATVAGERAEDIEAEAIPEEIEVPLEEAAALALVEPDEPVAVTNEEAAIELFGFSAAGPTGPPPVVALDELRLPVEAPAQHEPEAPVVPDVDDHFERVIRQLVNEMILAERAAIIGQMNAMQGEVAHELAAVRNEIVALKQLENMADPVKVAAGFQRLESMIGTIAQHVGRTSGLAIPGF